MNDGTPKAPSYFHFLAGLATGSISAALLQPADLLKTRVQQSQTSSLSSTLREILSSPNAVAQLWRGTIPSVVRTGLGSALYFSTLDTLRRGFARLTPSLDPAHAEQLGASKMRGSNLGNLLSGAVARTSAGFVLMPVTVIKVRYESSLYKYSSMSQAVTSIIRTEGVRGLFAGFGATAIRDAPYAGLYVLFYEQTRRYMTSTFSAIPGTDVSSGKMATVNFSAGLIAAATATAITNPFDALKTRIQLMPGKYGNLFKAASQIIRHEGVKSLFDGLGLRMARKAASSALSWTLYEEIIRRAERRVVGIT